MLAWLEPLVLSMMGFLSWFYVEHKAFELSAAEVYSVLCLLKEAMGWVSPYCWVSWVLFGCRTWWRSWFEGQVIEFFKLLGDGNKAFIA
jgi:hypothetical protein